jgi:hypothetical protein
MSDWCASRNVVSVMSRRFCLSVHSANFFGPSSSSSWPGAARRFLFAVVSGNWCGGERRGRFVTFRVRVAVDDDVAEEIEELRCAVFARAEMEQLRRRVDHRRRRLPAAEKRMMKDILEERDICLHTANAHLAQSAVHPVDTRRERSARWL